MAAILHSSQVRMSAPQPTDHPRRAPEGQLRVDPDGLIVVPRTAGIGSAGRPAKSRWCKSITMKEQRSTSAPSHARAVVRPYVKRALQLNTQFICVDTWLGSNNTLWLNAEFRKSLMLKNGYPTMFRQFVRNIVEYKADSAIFPLPMTSSAAAYTLRDLTIVADVIYIDAGHEEEEVLTDLNLFYDRLQPGRAMFGDDYDRAWMGVVKAVNRFCADRGILLHAVNGKWLVEK
jgi:hypothetical protein